MYLCSSSCMKSQKTVLWPYIWLYMITDYQHLPAFMYTGIRALCFFGFLFIFLKSHATQAHILGSSMWTQILTSHTSPAMERETIWIKWGFGLQSYFRNISYLSVSVFYFRNATVALELDTCSSVTLTLIDRRVTVHESIVEKGNILVAR